MGVAIIAETPAGEAGRGEADRRSRRWPGGAARCSGPGTTGGGCRWSPRSSAASSADGCTTCSWAAGSRGPGSSQPLATELAQRIAVGDYPSGLTRTRARRRTVWYHDYIVTLVQRDVRDLSRIRRLDALPRLLSLAASQISRLLNVTELAGPFQVSRPTMHDFLTLLERVFLLETLQPWHTNRLSRLVKTPKLRVGSASRSASRSFRRVQRASDHRVRAGAP